MLSEDERHKKFLQTKKTDAQILDLYQPLVAKARVAAGLSHSDLPDALVLSIIKKESSGSPWARSGDTAGGGGKGSYYGLLQIGSLVLKDLAQMGTYAGTNPRDVLGKEYEPIYYFMRIINKYRSTHGWDPEKIYLVWNQGVGFTKSYNQALAAGEDPSQFLKKKKPNIPAVLGDVERGAQKYALKTGEHIDKFRVTGGAGREGSWTVKGIGVAGSGDSGTETIYGKEDLNLTMTAEQLSTFYTPEEMRKGILAQVYHINDWQLLHAGSPDRKESDTKKGTTTTSSTQISDPGEPGNKASRAASTMSDRFMKSFVEAEFYRRRYAARSVNATVGPFNPYPVAGFPGLIMHPRRPVMGMIDSVNHTINVAGSTGTTSISMTSPRYWNEGEVWYWCGGEESSHYIMRNFPIWHNRFTVAVNNVSDPFSGFNPVGARGLGLDLFYQFYLGCPSIPYYSNNTGRATPDSVLNSIKNRDPGGLEVSEETLEIREYNQAVAMTDEKGRFLPGTIAHRFFGSINPYEVVESTASVESQIEYVERYGVTEEELFVGFLGNKFETVAGNTVVVGPTFGGDKINAIQNHIIEYIKDLEERMMDGGV